MLLTNNTCRNIKTEYVCKFKVNKKIHKIFLTHYFLLVYNQKLQAI